MILIKHGRKPNRRQKELMKEYGLDASKWLIVKNLDEELHVVHREVPQTKVLPKY